MSAGTNPVPAAPTDGDCVLKPFADADVGQTRAVYPPLRTVCAGCVPFPVTVDVSLSLFHDPGRVGLVQG